MLKGDAAQFSEAVPNQPWAALNGTSMAGQSRAPLLPIVKWPGGKRWLVELYPELLPKRLNGRYLEPFVGGGAVFFRLRPERALLADANPDLIQAYASVRDHTQALLELLRRHERLHSKAHYYRVRTCVPADPIERSARFLYLNRTCFNGIYRVNREGIFNVPIGSKTRVLLPSDDWQQWALALRSADLRQADFESLIDEAGKGDFVFADPPYTVHHNRNGFIKYNQVLFSWEDQVRLADSVNRARKRGARILLTNANHASVRKLYGRGFEMFVVSRYSSMSASANGRDIFDEIVVKAN